MRRNHLRFSLFLDVLIHHLGESSLGLIEQFLVRVIGQLMIALAVLEVTTHEGTSLPVWGQVAHFVRRN